VPNRNWMGGYVTIDPQYQPSNRDPFNGTSRFPGPRERSKGAEARKTDHNI
jgi:hypothetical protein